jgi:acetyl esterase/lipase
MRSMADAVADDGREVLDIALPLPAARDNVAVRIIRGRTGAKQACIVYLHGGYFNDGGMDDAMPLARELANAATVVMVDYPLAPVAVFPAALETSFSVLEWVAGNARLMQIDPLRLYVGGDEAGGNLAAALAMVARDRLFGHNRYRRVAGQILITPLLDSVQTTASLRAAPSHPAHRAWARYLSTPRDIHHPYVSPLWSRRLPGLPPALLVTADGHPLRDETELYAARLRKAGVQVQLHTNSAQSQKPAGIHDPGFAATAKAVQAFLRTS